MRAEDRRLAENLAKAAAMVRKASEAGAQICVFPELMDTGFDDITRPAGDAQLAFPIPGKTTDRLGEVARNHGVWIVAALLERVEGGSYDTNVVINSQGKVVHKQRKSFCYPVFAAAPAFQGNYLDFRTVPSPWGPLAVMNCVDTGKESVRKLVASAQPSLLFVNLANPQANLPGNCNVLAAECSCPVVGANMIFGGDPKKRGGGSRIVAAGGRTLWEGGAGEEVKVLELTVRAPHLAAPYVEAGDVQTVRMPAARAELRGRAFGDGELLTSWSTVSAPGNVTFADGLSPQTTATFDAPGTYVLRLEAGNGRSTRSDHVAVNVLPAAGGDPSLIGHWTFDETLTDRSGNGNSAQLDGDAGFVADPPPNGLGSTHSLSLRGGAFALVPHSPALDAPRSFTVALWFKLRSSPVMWPTRGVEPVALLTKGNQWNRPNYGVSTGEYYYLAGRGLGGMICPGIDPGVLSTGGWRHVAAVFDADMAEGKLYVDGVLQHRVANAPTDPLNADPIYMGRYRNCPAWLDGLLADVRVYNRPLSDAEVAELVPGARANSPPAVRAGPDIEALKGEPVELVGSFEDDGASPSARAAAWARWSKVSGPGEVIFDGCFSASTSARLGAPGRYELVLVGCDGAHVVSDTVAVNVR